MTNPKPTTAAERERWRELCEKATPGPWELWTSNSWRRFGSTDGNCCRVCEPIVQEHDGHPDLHFPNGGENGPDARLIAESRTALPRLLADVERLEKIREAAERYVSLAESEKDDAAAIEAWAALRKVLKGE